MLKINLLSIAVSVLLFSACDKKDPAPAIPVSEAKSLVSGTVSEVETNHSEFVNAEGMKANAVLSDFDFLGDYAPGDPTTTNLRKSAAKSLKSTRMRNAITKYIPKSISRTMLDAIDGNFSNAIGIYEYNATTDSFDKTSSEGTSVVVKFPYPKTNSTNNAAYTVSKYSVKEINGNTEPTEIQANLKVNDATVLTISLIGKYDSNGDPENLALDYTFENKSIKATIISNSNTITVGVYYSKNSTILLGLETAILFTNSDKSESSLITSKYILGKVTFNAKFNVYGLFNDPETSTANTEAKVNALYDKYFIMTLNRSSDNVQFAEVKLRFNQSSENANYVIFYTDGSQGDFAAVFNALAVLGVESLSFQ